MSRAAVAAGRCTPDGGAEWESYGATTFDENPPGSAIEHDHLIEAREIVRMLRQCGLTDATIARVVGTTKRKLAAWERSVRRPPGVARLQNLGRIVRYLLGGASTPRDVGRWLCTATRHLAGRPPIELLGEGWRPDGSARPAGVVTVEELSGAVDSRAPTWLGSARSAPEGAVPTPVRPLRFGLTAGVL